MEEKKTGTFREWSLHHSRGSNMVNCNTETEMHMENKTLKPSFREHANQTLAKCRRMQAVGLVCILGTFFFLPYCQWLAIATAFGICLMFRAYLVVRKQLVCPGCGKQLHYLVLNPSYTGPGTNGAWWLPKSFAPSMTQCPYCGRLFDEPEAVSETSSCSETIPTMQQ